MRVVGDVKQPTRGGGGGGHGGGGDDGAVAAGQRDVGDQGDARQVDARRGVEQLRQVQRLLAYENTRLESAVLRSLHRVQALCSAGISCCVYDTGTKALQSMAVQ